jgi:poly-gamma-glutamate synthesis protein (capsule biosynthesis protein)
MRHKVALMPHEKLHVQLSRGLLDASVCGMEIRMKKIWRIIFVVLTVLVLYMVYDIVTDVIDNNQVEEAAVQPSPSPSSQTESSETTVEDGGADDVDATDQTAESEEKKTCTLVSVGDVLGHESVIYSNPDGNGNYDYDKMFERLKSDFTNADLAVVNQETIFAGTQYYDYGGYPCFNSPEGIGDAEVRAGFDVILHATNHARDCGEEGIEYCFNYWKTSHPDITVLGIHDSVEDQQEISVVEKNGIKIAMLNYTYSLNGFTLAEGKEYLVDLIDEDRIRDDIERARTMADFVVVFPHWGIEYQYEPNEEQKELAQMMADAGADAIIGTHPHVLESVEWLEGESGNKTLCYYSLGNYVSGQVDTPTMLGGMARLTFVKEGEETYIEDPVLVPLVTHYTWHGDVYTAATYKLSEYTEELAAQHTILNYDSTFSLSELKRLAEEIVGDDWLADS